MGSPRWRSLAGWWKSWKSTRCSAMGAQLYRPPTLCTSRVMTREVQSVGGRYNCAPIAEHLVLFQLFHQPASDLHRGDPIPGLSLIHISEPTRLRRISYAVFCLKKKK